MKAKRVNRRDFLKLSATVGAGALLAPAAVASAMEGKTIVSATQENNFPTRILGRTGVKMPILSMGVMRADNPNVVRAAYNSGIFHFDTAYGYQNGRNEEMLGNFFADKPRDKFFIATKMKLNYPLRDDFEQQFNAGLDTSLKRLKMDYVDIFYAHSIPTREQVVNERIVAAMKKIKEDGKAKYLGLSSHDGNPDVILAAIDAKVYDVILFSYNFSLKNLKETEEAIEKAAKAGIGIVVMKSMAGGRTGDLKKSSIDAKACLKWVWNNENITTIIPGFVNFDQLDECLAAVSNPQLSAEEYKYLASLSGQELLYCQQCGECLQQCPNRLPIPDLMRAYMYAYGYNYAQLSKETMAEVNFKEDACAGCNGDCKVKCPSGFNVGNKIAAIASISKTPSEFLT